MNSPQTTTEIAAVADAIRSHDRFLLVTHENPDGDALGSILATKLALDQLGKDSVMYLYGSAPLPAEYRFMELEELRRDLPADWPKRARTCTGSSSGSTRRCSSRSSSCSRGRSSARRSSREAASSSRTCSGAIS